MDYITVGAFGIILLQCSVIFFTVINQ